MHQVKIFKTVETQIGTLEKEVNDWLQKTGAKIISMTGNIAPQSGTSGASKGGLGHSPFPPSDVILIVLYEK